MPGCCGSPLTEPVALGSRGRSALASWRFRNLALLVAVRRAPERRQTRGETAVGRQAAADRSGRGTRRPRGGSHGSGNRCATVLETEASRMTAG